MNAIRKLVDAGVICADCGACCLRHEPPGGTGYATLANGSRVCYQCADNRQRAEFAAAECFTAYLGSGDRLRITTWTGGSLARVVEKRLTRKPCAMGGCFYYVRAVAPDGSLWWGYSPGCGCYVNLRRMKGGE